MEKEVVHFYCEEEVVVLRTYQSPIIALGVRCLEKCEQNYLPRLSSNTYEGSSLTPPRSSETTRGVEISKILTDMTVERDGMTSTSLTLLLDVRAHVLLREQLELVITTHDTNQIKG